MKAICIGNYPPRQCGIATFTENLIRAILKAADQKLEKLDLEIIAMNDGNQNYPYPPIVTRTIADRDKESYVQAAEYINKSGFDICLVQHEYGIYGGESGLLLLALLRRLRIPIITTFHTVLQKPSFHQREVLQKIAAYSTKLVVMNQLAFEFLEESFQVHRSKVLRIQHGVPEFQFMKKILTPKPKTWENRRVMLTFGLIGRSKGIETVLRALPDVVKKHPEVLYVVLGKTHPSIIRHSGEEYREYLFQLVQELGLVNNIEFINQYVNEIDLMSYLTAADIYITPYLNKAQITSGTLSYAVASGCAVVSTPYWHAEELLADGRGKLFDFNDFQQLSDTLLDLLENPKEIETLKTQAFEYGKTMYWPIIGDSYLTLFQDVINDFSYSKKKICNALPKPIFDITHLKRLTDNTGILQHARNNIPNFKTGYCLDDNSRALMLCLLAWDKTKDKKLFKLMDVYLSYMLMAQQKDGSFKNFMSYHHETYIKDIEGDYSDDAFGRAFWAMGSLVNYAPNDAMFHLGLDMFAQSEQQLQNLKYVRGFANVIFGLDQYIKRFPDQERYRITMERIADKLCSKYDEHNRENWHWFEDSITYDNGLLPASLYKAYLITQKRRYLEIAEESRAFLETKVFREEWLSLIGNRRWLKIDDDFSLFAQQPIDAMAMVIMYNSAYQATKSLKHISKLITSFYWFLGYNDLNISLIDSETKGCNDGIEEFNINRNQGAESMISYLLSYLVAEPYLK